MKKFNSQLKILILSLSIIAFPLSMIAELERENSSEDHVPVGTRCLSSLENYQLQKMRAELSEKNVIENIESEDLKNEDLIERKTFFTSHPGVFHHPIAVSPSGDNVTLEDGSLWHVRSKDKYQTLDWLLGDTILVLPNHSWFSSYKFVLLNQNTGKKVKVNMLLGPIYNGIHTHWITSIDLDARKVWLEDNSVWEISGLDQFILKKWMVNDTVVIGINDALFSGRPNILINVNVLNYAAASCLN